MFDLAECIEKVKNKYGIENDEFNFDLSLFFVSNRWFGEEPKVHENGKILVDDSRRNVYETRLDEYCRYYGCDNNVKQATLLKKLSQELPKTGNVFLKYCKDVMLDDVVAYKVLDFLLYYLPGEIETATDKDIAELMTDGFNNLPKSFSDVLADFINWTRVHTKTFYYRDYFMNSYGSKSRSSEAYDPDDYLKILYYMFNEDYISENDMYAKAAQSKNYVDTWLFISLHFISAIRNSDIIRIPHPRLTMEPQVVLNRIQDGIFESVDAKLTLYSILYHLSALQLTPNKTSGTGGVSTIKFHVPESAEVHFGTLFAIAEAFHQLKGLSKETPLIRAITTYEQISRYMGEDIGELFLESNFRSRSANKSYLQMIYMLTNDILENNDQFSVKGYILAALARSHKGSYGEFARTTSIYLRDAKMSGFSPEFVARELFERGVLSFVPATLLKIITGGEYEKLSVSTQTSLIKELNLSPIEVEKAVSLSQSTINNAVNITGDLYESNSQKEILLILHRIGNGEAVSKQDESMCLITACRKIVSVKRAEKTGSPK